MTELDDKSDHLKSIMSAAAAPVYQDCRYRFFRFVMYKGDEKTGDRKTAICCKFLEKAEKAGVSYDADRKCGLLTVHPKRKDIFYAEWIAEQGGQLWVSSDSLGEKDFVAISVIGKSRHEASRRAASKVQVSTFLAVGFNNLPF